MFSPKGRDLERGWPGRIEGDRVIQLAAQTLQAFFTGGGTAREHDEYPLSEVVLRPPVLHPPSIRVFEPSDGPPRFHFGNPASVVGPGDDVPLPSGASAVDARPLVAAVVGADGAIGGFTLMNDWRARELPPPKDEDFATSLGPVLLTPDELGRADVELRLAVGGEERARARLGEARLWWDEIVTFAGRNTRLLPGDVVAAGPREEAVAEARAGDVVEIAAAGFGGLRNVVTA